MKSTLLSPFSLLYGAIVKTRRMLYEKRFFASFELGVKTISVGNITVGGTGKTPLVAMISEILLNEGERVCILTRGYGRDNPKERVLVADGERVLADAREAGDEPFELANKLEGRAIIIADADRAGAGKWALEEFGVTVFVLDDGFQHLRLKRHLDLVLLDATNPFGNGKMLPAGVLRESLLSLKCADAVIITRANLVQDVSDIKTKVAEINTDCRIFVSRNEFTDPIKLKGFLSEKKPYPKSKIQNLKSTAFCALGNPDNFFAQLRQEGFSLATTQSFADHHIYTQNEIRNLEKKAVESAAEILLTTAKDAVKLTHVKFNLPCFVMENGLTIDDESVFIELIQNPESRS
jgi:tetraacyldisaccharide 4'-kinase